MEQQKQRIEFIDCMRGFTMILVVYSHVCLSALSLDSNINAIFIRFRMPLFFFISGFMLYSSRPFEEWIKKRLKNRLLNQFLPTFATGLIYTLFVSLDPIGFFYDPSKYGYWFTIVLFEIFFIYLIITILMDKLYCGKQMRLFILGFVSSVCFILQALSDYYYAYNEQNYFNLFSLRLVLRFTPFVFGGVICRMYLSQFQKIINNNIVNFSIIILFIFCHLEFLPSSNLTFLLAGICGIIIVFHIFQSYKSFFSNNTIIGKGLSYIGKNTLPIYFLHSFFLTGIRIQCEEFHLFLQSNWFCEFLFCFTVSMFIVFSTLVLDKMLQSFELLHSIMFGPKIKKKRLTKISHYCPIKVG